MRLLFITQRVNSKDPVLGFVHLWLVKFSNYFASIEVICLEAGEYNLPHTISVHSLGKERGRSRFKYVYNLFTIAWRKRHSYDVVFVHMNVEYLVLLGWGWLLWRKRTVLWYNHRSGSLMARYASLFAQVICYTSPFSFFAKNKKSVQMPAGIDTDVFVQVDTSKTKNSLLCLGRISVIKNVDMLIDALYIVGDRASMWRVKIIGNPEDNALAYARDLYDRAQPLVERGILEFLPGVSLHDAVHEFQSAQWYVNMTNSGSLDKTILEAMACGSLPIVSNQSFKGIIPEQYLFAERDIQSLTQSLITALATDTIEQDQLRQRYRAYVVENHSLDVLVKKVFTLYE